MTYNSIEAARLFATPPTTLSSCCNTAAPRHQERTCIDVIGVGAAVPHIFDQQLPGKCRLVRAEGQLISSPERSFNVTLVFSSSAFLFVFILLFSCVLLPLLLLLLIAAKAAPRAVVPLPPPSASSSSSPPTPPPVLMLLPLLPVLPLPTSLSPLPLPLCPLPLPCPLTLPFSCPALSYDLLDAPWSFSCILLLLLLLLRISAGHLCEGPLSPSSNAAPPLISVPACLAVILS